VEADGHLELLDRVPEGLEFRVVDVASADRVGVADHGHGPQLADGAPGLADRQDDIVEGDLRRELQPLGVIGAEVARPVVVGPGQGRGHLGLEIVVHLHLASARAVDHGHVDALDVHRRHVRLGVVAARVRDLVVRVPGEGAPLKVLADQGTLRPLRHLADLDGPDPDDGLIPCVLRPPDERRREPFERLLEVLLPEPVRLHRVQVAVHHPEAVLHRGSSPVVKRARCSEEIGRVDAARPQQGAELAQARGLDLPDAFPGQAKPLADCLELLGRVALEAEAPP